MPDEEIVEFVDDDEYQTGDEDNENNKSKAFFSTVCKAFTLDRTRKEYYTYTC